MRILDQFEITYSDGANYIHPGDKANIAGLNNTPGFTRTGINESRGDFENPERALISKERWAIVRQLLLAHEELRDFFSWTQDYLEGFKYAEIARKYAVSPYEARERVLKCLAYLRKKIKGHQF